MDVPVSSLRCENMGQVSVSLCIPVGPKAAPPPSRPACPAACAACTVLAAIPAGGDEGGMFPLPESGRAAVEVGGAELGKAAPRVPAVIRWVSDPPSCPLWEAARVP